MKHMTFALALLTVALFAGAVAFAGSGPFAGPGPYNGYGQNRPAECPDADGDGICNGQDPDYVHGDQCLNGDCPNLNCPDADGDGICNGQDPDYVPGDQCTDPQCPNPTCPDADGDGICNGQDEDYVPPGIQKRHHGTMFEGLRARIMQTWRMIRFGF